MEKSLNSVQLPKSVHARVVLGVTGTIAAYKSAELARLFVKAGVDVQVVMTRAAMHFITPVTFQALTGNPVITDLWDARFANNMAHIDLTRDAQALVIAPATAHVIARLANGLCDDLLTTLALARPITRCPLFIAPAMNREMWEHAANVRNTAVCKADGAIFLGPEAGSQACGEVGMGRMIAPEEIFSAVMVALAYTQKCPKRMAGKRVLITGGPTVEAIDPVRSITNASSGRMAYAIAAEAQSAGATVTLVSGPCALAAPQGVQVVQVKSAAQMLAAVQEAIDGQDYFFAVAAVADYTPVNTASQKMKKQQNTLTITLQPTVDILATVAARAKPPFCIGFAAESENVIAYASEKRLKKNLPMIVANLATSAIGAADNEVTIIDAAGETHLPRADKQKIAAQIVAHAAKLYENAKQ
jgi:phosphopantothenoylcysteine decarboxylase / phosphopantothenate---cysteine ligase